jgi:hypothetical protein
MAWYRNWGKKHYQAAKKSPLTPYYLISLLGERIYELIYKISMTAYLIGSLSIYIWFLIKGF